MKRFLVFTFLGTLTVGVASVAHAFEVLTPNDFIIAIDLEGDGSQAAWPGGEAPPNALDGDAGTKYLNFGELNSGIIVTPAFGSSTVRSLVLTTANDAEERDPATYQLYGTNAAIVSQNDWLGLSEPWTLISTGALGLPAARQTMGPTVDFVNASAYTSYKLLFPTVKNADAANSMQIADIQLYTGPGATGSAVVATGDVGIGIDGNLSPPAESVANAVDRDVNTKYLNFAKANSGFIVTPAVGATAVNGFQITTANDAESRDPASWELYGTNAPIASADNSLGNGEAWTLIESGTLALPATRLTPGDVVAVNNTTPYASYRMVFPTLKDPLAANADSIQYAEIQFFAPGVNARLEVDRSTGEMRIVTDENIAIGSYEIESPTAGALIDSAWTSITDTGADPDDAWTKVSNAGDPYFLAEEDTASGANNGLSLTAGNSYSLGSVWGRTPLEEDIIFRLMDQNGELIATNVTYAGSEVVSGDYNGDGVVTASDWPTFRAGLGGDYTGMSPAQAYLSGDLDGDFDSDLDDFRLFVEAGGGFAALFGEGATVPEPSSLALLLGIGAILSYAQRRRFRTALAAVAFCGLAVALFGRSAEAQIFTNLGPPVTVTTPDPVENDMAGPENLFDDTFLDDTPAEFNDQLFNADYSSEFLMDLLQYAGAGPAPKTVFMDFGVSITTNWFAYAQRAGGNPLADRIGKFEFWFSNTDFGGVLPGTDPDTVYEFPTGDSRVADSILRPFPLFGEHTGRYAAMRLTIADLSVNQPTNNIGGHEFRFMSGPSDIVVQVDRETGAMTMRNNGSLAQPIDIKAYEIHSEDGALVAGGFNGIRGDSGAFPAGNGTGNGWEIGGGSGSFSLIEAYFSGSSTMAAGTAPLQLGTAYNVSSLSEDLTFRYTNSQGYVYDGRVEYVGVAPGLPGDYNSDGMVNAADYTVWRDNVGAAAGTLPNDVNGGVIGTAQYNTWKANFGAPGAGSGSGAAVPEPSAVSWVLLGCGIVGVIGARRRLP